MDKFKYITKEELLQINGGSQKSYETGYSIGHFVGSLFGVIDRIIETFK